MSPSLRSSSGRRSIAAVALGMAVIAVLGAGSLRSVSHVRFLVPTRHGLGSLPLGARGPVAAALGANDRAYWVHGFSVRNPAQELRAVFSPAGTTIHSGGGWMRLSLSGIGRAGDVRRVGRLTPVVHRNRVVYSYGAVRAWYANGPLGLEQGFDLARPPASGTGRMVLGISLSGDLRPRNDRGGVVFAGHGVSLRYSGLVAYDARGRRLPASVGLRHGRLVISVDDRGARYPLRVDPFVQQAELTASDGAADDEFGSSVAVDGNTIVVGAPNHAGGGAVYVFTKKAGWANSTQTAELTVTGDPGVGGLGSLVAISGDTVAASAPSDNGADGAVYVFVKPTGGWADEHQTAELTDSHVPNGDHLLGDAGLAIQGNTIAADKYDDIGGPSTVDVWVKPATGWANHTESAVLSTGAAYAEFSVGMDGNTIIAGGGGDAVYVFTEPSTGWKDETSSVVLTSSDDTYHDNNLGGSVAIKGGTIVAGAPGSQGGVGGVDVGSVFVFTEPSNGWHTATQTAELNETNGSFGDSLGESVALSANGNTIMASAPGNSLAGYHSGTIYTFSKPSGGWANTSTPSGKLTASDSGTTDSMGHSIAMTGNGTLVAGAFIHKVGSNATQGDAYVFSVPIVKVSGSIYGASCGAKSCSPPSGIGGFTVLVHGTAIDGDPVDETALSGGDGSWSVKAPSGTYTAGLTKDGSRFVSKTMEQPVTVNTAPVTGVNFTSCAAPVSASGAADQSSAFSTRFARAAEASFSPSYCESEYTVKLSAKIPQPILVDASKNAHYNTSDNNGPNGFNHSPAPLEAIRQTFRTAAGFNQEYPECMRPGQVGAFSNDKATAEWYSYIKAGKVIGSATLKYIWNQSTKTVELASVPTITNASLTRIFVWRVHLRNGKVVNGKCPEKAQVPMLLVAQPTGASEGGGGEEGEPRSFTILAAWSLPFDDYGAQIDPDTPLAEKVVDAGLQLTKRLFKGGGELLERYEKLPAWTRFLIEVPVTLLIGAAEEKAIVGGLTKAADFYKQYSAGAKLTAEELEQLELVGSVKGLLEHHVQIPLEAMGVLTGYFGYPVMSAVIRGQFTTTKYLPSAEVSPPREMPYQQTLAVTARTTQFPSISLEISRDALNTCLSGCKVWEGTLPWKSSPTSEPETFNPFSTENPAYYVEDSTKHGYPYRSGIAAVRHVIKDTKQNRELAYSVRHNGNLTSGYAAALGAVPGPECDPDTGHSNSLETICWIFNDWRP
jgi:hypothetical protein